jgi:hypothetical protein
MVWYGMVWYGMVWYGMVWYGMVWYGMVWLLSLNTTMLSLIASSFSPLHVEVHGSYPGSSRRSSKRATCYVSVRRGGTKDPSLNAPKNILIGSFLLVAFV